jgi:hypothetical protein
MREFPQGRWTNHTSDLKDKWLGNAFYTFVAERIKIETNKALRRAGTNEYGDKGRIKSRFNNHKDCVNAYKNLFCWLNFPRCDPVKDLSLPTCESACVNYFKSCGYKKDLYRCGPMEYMNGYAPEVPQATNPDGTAVYIRDYFPGSPFAPNKFNKLGNDLPMCTPAIIGAASSMLHANAHFSVLVMLIGGIAVMLL